MGFQHQIDGVTSSEHEQELNTGVSASECINWVNPDPSEPNKSSTATQDGFAALTSETQVNQPIFQSGRPSSLLQEPFPDSMSNISESTPSTVANSGVGYVVSKLFPDQKLGLLLKHCFDELEAYYPCIDRISFYERLSAFFIESCSCREGITWIPMRAEELSFAALICGMLRLGTYWGGAAERHETIEGDKPYLESSWSWHLEGRKILDRIPWWREEPNLDILRFYTLEVLYMSMLEKRGNSTNAMAIAVDLAFALSLNNEASWTVHNAWEKEQMRLLWWTIYYLDRRVALRERRSMLINDTDFIVGELDLESKEKYLNQATSAALRNMQTSNCALSINWPQPSKLTDDWYRYYIFQLRWSKVVTRIWDEFLSLRAVKQIIPEKISEADALIMKLQEELPPSLVWDSRNLPSTMRTSDMDRAFRLQLVIFEVASSSVLILTHADRTIRRSICSAFF